MPKIDDDDDDPNGARKQRRGFHRTLFLVVAMGAASVFLQRGRVVAVAAAGMLADSPSAEPPPVLRAGAPRSPATTAAAATTATEKNHRPASDEEPSSSAVVEDASSTGDDDPQRAARRRPGGSSPAVVHRHDDDDEEEDCRRKCHPQDGHRNIVLVDHFGKAGISDRIYVLRRLAVLAGYLCARVHAPPPYTMLSTFHNAGRALPKNLTWTDMEDIRFLDDNSSAVVPYELDPVDDRPGIREPFHLNEYFRGPEHNNWLRLRFKNDGNENGTFRKQAEKLDGFVTKQQRRDGPIKRGFIWEMYPVLYDFSEAYEGWRLETIARGGEDCPYTEISKATTASLKVKDRVIEHLQQRLRHPHHPAGRFVLLHIRRGDTVDVCDTSLRRMWEFLSCSVRGVADRDDLQVLLATDERDPCYRRGIRTMIEGLGLAFVDLDATVWDVLRRDATTDVRLLNNMFVYKVISEVREDGRIGPVLEKRRRQCPDCQPLASSLALTPQSKSSPELRIRSRDEAKPNFASSEVDLLEATLNAYEACTTDESQVTT